MQDLLKLPGGCVCIVFVQDFAVFQSVILSSEDEEGEVGSSFW